MHGRVACVCRCVSVCLCVSLAVLNFCAPSSLSTFHPPPAFCHPRSSPRPLNRHFPKTHHMHSVTHALLAKSGRCRITSSGCVCTAVTAVSTLLVSLSSMLFAHMSRPRAPSHQNTLRRGGPTPPLLSLYRNVPSGSHRLGTQRERESVCVCVCVCVCMCACVCVYVC